MNMAIKYKPGFELVTATCDNSLKCQGSMITSLLANTIADMQSCRQPQPEATDKGFSIWSLSSDERRRIL